MRRSFEFIKAELEVICKLFTGISVKYAYEHESAYHIIEIEPMDKLEEDSEFVKWGLEFTERFESMFENENLLISEESCLNNMADVIYESNSNHISDVVNVEKFNICNLNIDFDCSIFGGEFLAA